MKSNGRVSYDLTRWAITAASTRVNSAICAFGFASAACAACAGVGAGPSAAFTITSTSFDSASSCSMASGSLPPEASPPAVAAEIARSTTARRKLVPASVGASHPVPASCWRKVAYALSDWCAWSQIPSHSSQSGATSAFTRATAGSSTAAAAALRPPPTAAAAPGALRLIRASSSRRSRPSGGDGCLASCESADRRSPHASAATARSSSTSVRTSAIEKATAAPLRPPSRCFARWAVNSAGWTMPAWMSGNMISRLSLRSASE